MLTKDVAKIRRFTTHAATLAALALTACLLSPHASAEKAGPMDEKAMQFLQSM